jgi:hypothetical protein
MTTNDSTVGSTLSPTRSRPWIGLTALTSAAHMPALVAQRSDPRRVVVTEADGTHMGLALSWWASAIRGDEQILAVIRQTVSPADVLRSAIEVILAQVAVIAAAEETCPAALLRDASGPLILTESHRALCRDLANALDRNPDTTEIEMTALPVTHVMDFVVLLGRLVEYRGLAVVSDQIERYTRMVTTAERLR